MTSFYANSTTRTHYMMRQETEKRTTEQQPVKIIIFYKSVLCNIMTQLE